MKFGTKEVGFMSKKNLGSFDFAEIEALGRYFVRCCHNWVDIWPHTVAEGLGSLDDVVESGFFLRLKW